MGYSDANRSKYKATNAYKEVENPTEWELCPNCNLKPLVWIFDNGRSTACGCGSGIYDHISIHAESITSVTKNSHNGASVIDYNSNELRDNWNHFCKTGEELFTVFPPRTDNRW